MPSIPEWYETCLQILYHGDASELRSYIDRNSIIWVNYKLDYYDTKRKKVKDNETLLHIVAMNPEINDRLEKAIVLIERGANPLLGKRNPKMIDEDLINQARRIVSENLSYSTNIDELNQINQIDTDSDEEESDVLLKYQGNNINNNNKIIPTTTNNNNEKNNENKNNNDNIILNEEILKLKNENLKLKNDIEEQNKTIIKLREDLNQTNIDVKRWRNMMDDQLGFLNARNKLLTRQLDTIKNQDEESDDDDIDGK